MQILSVDFYTTTADGGNTKMNARSQQNLKEILKEVGSKSLEIKQNKHDSKNEDWESAVAINKLGQQAFKILADDQFNKDWEEYAKQRLIDYD